MVVMPFSIKMKGEIFVEDLINMAQIGTVISEEKIFFCTLGNHKQEFPMAAMFFF
jgi:hypothetical protein